MKPTPGEVRRRKLLEFLEGKEPAWKESDHPELCEGCGRLGAQIAERERVIPPAQETLITSIGQRPAPND